MYVKSSKGGTVLIYRNHIFYLNKRSGSTVFWRCKTPLCRCSCSTKGGTLHKFSNRHNHLPHTNEIELKLSKMFYIPFKQEL